MTSEVVASPGFATLPRPLKALIAVRVVNRTAAFLFAYLAVFTGEALAPLALAVFGVTSFASRFIGARLMRRFDPRVALMIGLAWTGVSLIALSFTSRSVAMIVVIGFVGLAFEIYEPATQEVIARSADSSLRPVVYAWLGSAMSVASAISGVLSATLLPVGVQWLILADGITCCLAAGLVVALIPASQAARPSKAEAVADQSRSFLRRMRPPPTLVRLTTAHFAFAVGYMGLMLWMPTILLDRGASAWVPGVLSLANAAVTPLAVAAAVRWSPRTNHRLVLGLGMCVLAVTSGVMAFAALAVLIVMELFSNVVDSMMIGRWSAIVADLAPEASRPWWFATHGSVWGIASVVVPGAAAAATAMGAQLSVAVMLLSAASFIVSALLLPAVNESSA